MRRFISYPGKAFIVGATPEICAELYEEIVKLKPNSGYDCARRSRPTPRMDESGGRLVQLPGLTCNRRQSGRRGGGDARGQFRVLANQPSRLVAVRRQPNPRRAAPDRQGSTRRCGCGWPSSTPTNGTPPESRCPRRFDGCWSRSSTTLDRVRRHRRHTKRPLAQAHRCRTSFQSSNQRQRAFSERLTDLMRRYTKSAAAHLGNSDCRASRRSSRPSNCRPRTCWRRSPGNSSACADDVRAKLRPYEGEELLGVDNIDHSVIEMAKEAVAEGTAGPL